MEKDIGRSGYGFFSVQIEKLSPYHQYLPKEFPNWKQLPTIRSHPYAQQLNLSLELYIKYNNVILQGDAVQE